MAVGSMGGRRENHMTGERGEDEGRKGRGELELEVCASTDEQDGLI